MPRRVTKTEADPHCAKTGATWRRDLRTRLVRWYRKHRRDLPWRNTRDPYAIWVSEIMLQQTQVATVVPYYLAFLKAFPTVKRLAAADEHDVLRRWEGLGYYRRARQFHAAAQVILERHGGVFPKDLAAVNCLPGIGRYTAGAIVSIAFDQPAPILEANTVRLWSRLVGYSGDVTRTAGQQLLWQHATDVLPAHGSRELNQALMELGSLICTPQAPACDRCPLMELCVAYATGEQDTIPRAKAKVKFESVHEAAVVVRRGERVLLRRCAPGERWAGLWDFLRFPVAARGGKALVCELTAKVREQSGLEIAGLTRFTTLKHGVTRFRITLDGFLAECPHAPSELADENLKWVRVDQLDQFALSTTGRKLSRLLNAEVSSSPASSGKGTRKAARRA
jgi:A/G-specific adenine glycosylase